MFSGYVIANLITAITSVFVGIFVYIRNRTEIINKTWFFLCICIIIWTLGCIATVAAPNKMMALLYNRLLYVGTIFIPVFFTHFTVSILGIERKKVLFIIYLLGFIFLPFIFTDMFVKDVVPKLDFRYYMEPGIIYYFFPLFFVGCVIYAHYELFKKYTKSVGLKRNQLKYLLISTTIGFGGGSMAFPLVFDIKIYPYGQLFVWFYTIGTTYAVLKYRLMDINIALKKGTVYAYLSFLLLAPCVLFIVFAQRFFFGEINYAFSSLVFVMLFLTVWIFSRWRHGVERFIERKLFKEKYGYKEALSKLSTTIISFLDENELFKKTGDILIDLGIEKVSFFLLDREKRVFALKASKNFDGPEMREFPKDDLFFKWIKENGKIIIKEELERFKDDLKIKPTIERLNSMESEVCIPLITRGELTGIINLGKKRSGDMYSHEDLELLANFSNQAVIALENARLYEDLKKTQLLMRRSDRLAAVGSLTAGLAHEIRNPLVAVKTFMQLLPERYDDKEFRDYFLNLTTSEVERISSLTSELLEFARPSEPSLQTEDLNEVLEKVTLLLGSEAKKSGIQITLEKETIPLAMIDKEQIKQVFLNLLLNAIEATDERGTIRVCTRTIQENGREHLQVEIADSGQGIAEDNLEHIFDPFFTTKEKGIGLGLSISHQIIQEHNGKIEVKSKLGEGTTFLVTLPVLK